MRTNAIIKVAPLLLLFALYPLSLPASANAAPGKQSTITSAFTVDENTSIAVKNEKLTFQVDSKYEDTAQVTADYTMVNTGSWPVGVDMLFPSPNEMTQSSVTADGIAVQSNVTKFDTLYQYGNEADGSGIIMDLDDVIKLYNCSKSGAYQPGHFKPDDELKVYSIGRKGRATDKVKYPKGAILFALGPNGYSQNGNDVSLDAYEPYKMYLLNGSSLTINGKAAAPKSEIKMREFALQMKSDVMPTGDEDQLSDDDYLNLFYIRIDRLIQRGGIISGEDLFGYSTLQSFTVLSYHVDFKPNETKDVKINYQIEAGYTPGDPASQNQESLYQYLLNPAKHWKAFERLEVQVIPGPKRTNLSYSTLPLNKNSDGSYSAVFNKLPKKDLEFILVENNLGVISEVLPDNSIIGGIMIAVVLAIAVVIIFVILKRRRKKRQQ